VKWVGGKGRLLGQLGPLLPSGMDAMRHIEPFAGGAAMFFASRCGRARLSDVNASLMRTYAAVRDDLQGVIAHLELLCGAHAVERYHRVRDDYNRGQFRCDAELAAAFIYLNRTCFNGLYRVNRAGHFNVPMGRYPRPPVADAEGLRATSERLRGVELAAEGFEAVLANATNGDFVYLDPPYGPVSRTASFRGYAEGGFSGADQERLRDVFGELTRRGIPVMLSNSDTDEVRVLYRGFAIVEVSAPRSVNSVPARRGRVRELVVRNYA
jgi:DNA adenine methylase